MACHRFSRSRVLAPARLRLFSQGKENRQEPAVVIGAPMAAHAFSPDGFKGETPALRVKLHSTGEQMDVPLSHVVALPARPFLPGEHIRRAMLSGDEEDATVRYKRALLLLCSRAPPAHGCASLHLARASQRFLCVRDAFREGPRPAASRDNGSASAALSLRASRKPARCGAQVVCTNSPTLVTIRLSGSGVTYASVALRLRHVQPLVAAPAPEAPVIKAPSTPAIETPPLSSEKADLSFHTISGKPMAALKQLVASTYSQLRDWQENPAAAVDQPLSRRFAAALEETQATHTVRFMLHGTAEHNVDSVLANGIRGRPGTNMRWFTTCSHTATQYAKGAQRMVVSAVLVPNEASHQHIVTVTRDEHHLPILVGRCF